MIKKNVGQIKTITSSTLTDCKQVTNKRKQKINDNDNASSKKIGQFEPITSVIIMINKQKIQEEITACSKLTVMTMFYTKKFLEIKNVPRSGGSHVSPHIPLRYYA